MGNRVLVTGGAGFIGSNVVRRLLADNTASVSIVDNFNDFYSPALKRKNIEDFLDDDRFTLFETDICDAEGLQRVFENGPFDSIIHLAARAGVRPSLEQPQLYVETNVNGTTNLLECARKFGTRQVVFGSSSSVYGDRCKAPFAESANVGYPISPYAATKIAGEVMCHAYSHLYNLPVVCLRFFTVYGACQRPDLAIHKFAKLISEGKPIPVFGDGTTRRDYTYIDDIVQGVMAALEYTKKPFDIFNLGESQTVELNRLIELLEENLGREAVIDRMPLQPGDVPMTCADINKSKTELGYAPLTGIEEGIAKFVEWYKQNARTIDQ
jgi:UDP-glucuronate 4-epimerase